MRILHCNGFTKEELENYKQILILNIFNGMKELVIQAEGLNIKVTRKNKKVATYFVEVNPYTEKLDAETVGKAKQLWADSGMKNSIHSSLCICWILRGNSSRTQSRPCFYLFLVLLDTNNLGVSWHLCRRVGKTLIFGFSFHVGLQKMWNRRNEIDFPTNLEYMMANIDRFAEPEYVPSNEDVLHARQRTTGVVETNFTVCTHIYLPEAAPQAKTSPF